MISGIAIVGGNGSGKTTLGKHLANLLGYKHIDVEDYYFIESDIPYVNPRTKEQVQELIVQDIRKYGSFVISSVNGDMGSDINSLYDHIVYIQAPLDIRLDRVQQRAFDKFGSRVLKGGDMYEQEQEFFRFVATRSLDRIDAWLQTLGLPVIYVDGTAPTADNALLIKKHIA